MQYCEMAPGKPCYMSQIIGPWACLLCGKPPKQAKIKFTGSKIEVFDSVKGSTVVLVEPNRNLQKMKAEVISAARKKGYSIRVDKFGRLFFEGI